ncbi:cyclin-T1 isoform X6 [Rana temporaria]|nr:cyclin-T1 isoform X6 [Rana temporaria]
MATNSLHLTTFSLQYTPPVVACVCIHLACKWSNWEIPVSTDGKPWWEYVDATVTLKLLDDLTHEFLQILEKTPNRLKRIRNWRIYQANRKPKDDDDGEDEDGSDSLSDQALIRMISRSGPMGKSPFSDSSSQPFPVPKQDSGLSGESWGAPQNNQREHQRTSELIACTDQSQLPGNKPTLAKVSLKDYRAKHAGELAAQKRQLENMGASLKEQYASAAQNLLIQQQKDRKKESPASPIILKIPLHEVSHERTEKTPSLKLRLPVPIREKPEDTKIRIKVPNEESSSSGKVRDKHRSGSSSSHHHHHHNSQSHRQHHHNSSSSSSKRSSSSVAGSSHKTADPSRKRPLPEDITGHDPVSLKVSRTSIPSKTESPVAQSAHRAWSSHSIHKKTDRETSGSDGRSLPKVIDYKDTVSMIHSLLSAQGVQPIPPPQYLNQYGEYRKHRPSSTDKTRPPLPSEPPPPMPPLPK